MRLLTVTHFFESHGGGIERVAGQLCRQFARLGATPVWAASKGDKAPDGEIEAVPLGGINPTEKLIGLPMPIPGPGAIRSLSREVRRSDAVIIHDALYATSVLALLLAKVHGKRAILVQHIAGIPFSSRLLRGLMRLANRAVTRPMLNAADARVFISDTVRRDLAQQSTGGSGELLFNGVDTAIFRPGASSTPAMLAKIGGKGRRVLFVGRYVEKKGLTVLRALATSRPDLMFVLAGNGPMKPGAWRLPNVHDVGTQSPHALAELYRWADLLLLPSVGEGFPLVIQEAMACGLPAICGAPADRADPDASKWLRGVPIDLSKLEQSAGRCADAIDAFRPSESERAEMARYASRTYDWERMAGKMIALAGERKVSART